MQMIDPSVTDETRSAVVRPVARSLQPRQRLPRSRRRRAATRPSSSQRYRAAQRARVARLDAVARAQPRAARRQRAGRCAPPTSPRARGPSRRARCAASVAHPHMVVFRTEADLRAFDLVARSVGARRRLAVLLPSRSDQLHGVRLRPRHDAARLAEHVVGPVVERRRRSQRRRASPCRRWSLSYTRRQRHLPRRRAGRLRRARRSRQADRQRARRPLRLRRRHAGAHRRAARARARSSTGCASASRPDDGTSAGACRLGDEPPSRDRQRTSTWQQRVDRW